VLRCFLKLLAAAFASAADMASAAATKQNMSDPQFEVTQILATRVDSSGEEWLLVQWGCTWIPQSKMASGAMHTEYLKKPKLVACCAACARFGADT